MADADERESPRRQEFLSSPRISRTQSDNVSRLTGQREDCFEIRSVALAGWRLKRSQQGKIYASYIVKVVIKTGESNYKFISSFSFFLIKTAFVCRLNIRANMGDRKEIP